MSEFGVEECLAWCQAPESRKAWPGTREIVTKQGVLFYKVEIQTPGAAHALVSVEEHLRDPTRDQQQVVLESGMLWSWPGEEVVSAWNEFRFSRVERGTRLDLTHRYMLPGKAFTVIFNQTRLARSVRKAAQRYLDGLAQCGDPAGCGLVVEA